MGKALAVVGLVLIVVGLLPIIAAVLTLAGLEQIIAYLYVLGLYSIDIAGSRAAPDSLDNLGH
ncbi:MAG: hypothetical protein ACTSVD_03980 [Candidatus Thorarchaeota archaeon]